MWLECSQNVARDFSQSVIGGHWRSLEVMGGLLRSIQDLFRLLMRLCGLDGYDGLDGKVIIV